jgi:hypothetical protein
LWNRLRRSLFLFSLAVEWRWVEGIAAKEERKLIFIEARRIILSDAALRKVLLKILR